MATTVLEELVTILGFEVDDDGVRDYNAAVKDMGQNLRRVTLAGTAAAAAVGAYVTMVARAVDHTWKFSKIAGTAFDEVQRLSHAAEIMGSSPASVESSLSNLNRMASEAARGIGSGVEIFGLLGISATDAEGRVKTSSRLLGEIADRISTIGSEAEQAEFASKLGISEDMILLLRKGSRGIAELGAELTAVGAVLSPEQARMAEDFNDSMVRARAVIRGVGNEIGLRLAPRISEVAEGFFEWAKANREIVQSKLDEWIPILLKAIKPLTIFFGLLIAASAVFALMATTWAAPLLGVVAAAGALALALSDVNDYLQGIDDTLTERLLGRVKRFFSWEGFKDRVSGNIDFLHNLASRVPTIVPFAPSFAGAAAGAGGTTSTSNLTISPTIHISSTDPVGAGREVGKAIEEAARKAESSLRSPVVR